MDQPEDDLLVINDLLAQFKILVSYNGVPVTPDSIFCQFVEKDKAQPLKNQQFTAENLVSVPKENSNFICKYREGKPGVGVLDVYYIGDLLPQYIADYILVVGATLAVGRTTVFGTEIQDICLLGFPLFEIPQAAPQDGDIHVIVPDALGPYESCEDAALLQRQDSGSRFRGLEEMKKMNHRFIPAVAAFLILGVLLSATPLAYGVNVLTFGPKLEVVTIPQDNQKLAKGIIILGIDPTDRSDDRII